VQASIPGQPYANMPLLAAGDSGAGVQQAQQLLNREGALLADDGKFGPATATAVRACQSRHGLKVTGMLDRATWTTILAIPDPCPAIDIRAASFIAQEEVGSLELYNEQYTWPHWPGGQSGVTIGVGYDLRFVVSLQGDWGSHLDDGRLAMLNAWVGQPGSDDAIAALAGISVSWQSAWMVFTSRTLPRVLTQAHGAFPGMDKLPLLSAGALVSLVYNRGPGMAGPSRLEMREIRNALGAGQPGEVPEYIRAMIRLWPNSRDLRDRRRKEADLFEQGLAEAR
jgi:hypothetical protein